jgi:hypothetical protein
LTAARVLLGCVTLGISADSDISMSIGSNTEETQSNNGSQAKSKGTDFEHHLFFCTVICLDLIVCFLIVEM